MVFFGKAYCLKVTILKTRQYACFYSIRQYPPFRRFAMIFPDQRRFSDILARCVLDCAVCGGRLVTQRFSVCGVALRDSQKNRPNETGLESDRNRALHNQKLVLSEKRGTEM